MPADPEYIEKWVRRWEGEKLPYIQEKDRLQEKIAECDAGIKRCDENIQKLRAQIED